MQANIKLGRIFGIEVGLHYSWLIIALLVTLSLKGQFQGTNPQWGLVMIWTTAIATALLFFASIIAHELSHAAVAKANGLPVKAITLFALGGVAQIEKEAEDAKTEFWMGIVGPIASAIIGLACMGLVIALGGTPSVGPQTPLRAMLMWLGIINIVLAVFNMIPGFPMDGGRVLRAIVWRVTGDAAKATRIATFAGSAVGFGFIILGILRFFGGAGFGGLWLVFIGWFLLDAARVSRAYLETSESLRGVRVADVMTPNCPVIESRNNLQTFVNEHLLRTGHRCFVVQEQGRVMGIVTPHELKGVERAKWPYTTVDEVMLPLERLHTVDPQTLVTAALEMMAREDVNQLPVVLNGSVAGILSRGDVLRLLQTRAELQTIRSG